VTVRILGELDERQVRLGYANCVVLSAGRHLDTRTSLRKRFDGLVFSKVYEGTPEWNEFLAQIDEEGLKTLERQEQQRSRDRGGSKSKRDPVAILRRDPERGGRFRYKSHLWILQRCMPSHLGPLAPDRSEVFLEHTKHLGLLAETYSLTEIGHVLKQLLLQGEPHLLDGRAIPNPLYIGRRIALRALYLWALLENDILTPFLLREFLARRQNTPELLGAAAKALLEAFDQNARIDSGLEMKQLRDYHARVSKGTVKAEKAPVTQPARPKRPAESSISEFLARRAKSEPGFKVHRHHTRPRLEHYVDIGLLGRRSESYAADTVYEPVPETSRAVQAFAPLLENPKSTRRFLDTRFFGSAARVFGVDTVQDCTVWQALTYFAKAFALVGREIGFTPARTVSFAACLLALEDGRLAEISTMYEAVREGAKSALGEHLVFSGGSRFDGEFLIRVKPEADAVLRGHLESEHGVEGRKSQ
jgi:hypothetical protein